MPNKRNLDSGLSRFESNAGSLSSGRHDLRGLPLPCSEPLNRLRIPGALRVTTPFVKKNA